MHVHLQEAMACMQNNIVSHSLHFISGGWLSQQATVNDDLWFMRDKKQSAVWAASRGRSVACMTASGIHAHVMSIFINQQRFLDVCHSGMSTYLIPSGTAWSRTSPPSLQPISLATRVALAIAATRRGCVQMILDFP